MTKGRWQEFRASIIAERGSSCETCGKRVEEGLQAHEEWILDFSLKPALAHLSRIGLICWHCHMCEHFGRLNKLIVNGALRSEARDDVIGHFCQVNGVDREFFDQHYKVAMENWRRQSDRLWLIDWGEFRHLLPKTALRQHYDKDGNPVGWLSFDHVDVDRLGAFLNDLADLSRFYGVWIGQTNKRRPLPLHMREPGDVCGSYSAQTVWPWGSIPVSDPKAADFGAFMGWSQDPIKPDPTFDGPSIEDELRAVALASRASKRDT